MLCCPHLARKQKYEIQTDADTIRLAIKTSNDNAQKNRLRAILFIKEGASQTETAKRFVVCRVTVWLWLKAYNRGGADALRMNEGGRPIGTTVWDASIFEALAKEIDQREKKYWSVPLMRAWIKDTFGKDIPEQTIWYRMNALKYSYKSARPHSYQGDASKQEAFKKGGSKSRSGP